MADAQVALIILLKLGWGCVIFWQMPATDRLQSLETGWQFLAEGVAVLVLAAQTTSNGNASQLTAFVLFSLASLGPAARKLYDLVIVQVLKIKKGTCKPYELFFAIFMTAMDLYKLALKYIGMGDAAAPPSEAMGAADQGAKMTKACAASGVVQTVATAVGELAADAYWNSHNTGGGKPNGVKGPPQVHQKAEKTDLRAAHAPQQKQLGSEQKATTFMRSNVPKALCLIFCCILLPIMFMGAAPGGMPAYCLQLVYMFFILGCFLLLGFMSTRATLRARAAGISPPMVAGSITLHEPPTQYPINAVHSESPEPEPDDGMGISEFHLPAVEPTPESGERFTQSSLTDVLRGAREANGDDRRSSNGDDRRSYLDLYLSAPSRLARDAQTDPTQPATRV